MLWETNEETGCWDWLGPKKGLGKSAYGQIWFKGKLWYAHRLAYHRYHGDIPEGMVVMHSCDNPSCVNPEHLSVGTQSDNLKDAAMKGRLAASYGEHNCKAKLTDAGVIDIRKRREAGDRVADIARDYGISKPNTYNVINRKIWTHV